MKSSHILALIGTLSFAGIACDRELKPDLSSLERLTDSRKWTFEPKSYSEIEKNDQVTAIYSGGSDNPECTTYDSFYLVDKIKEDGKVKFIYKFEPDDSEDPMGNNRYVLSCTTKEVRHHVGNGEKAVYKYKKP